MMGALIGEIEAQADRLRQSIHMQASELVEIGRRIDAFDARVTAELRRRQRPGLDGDGPAKRDWR